MSKSQVTISVYVKNELKEKFEEVFQESEFNSKGEFLGILLENYLAPLDENDKESKQTIHSLQEQLERNEVEINELKSRKAEISIQPLHPVVEDSFIVLQTSSEQLAILQKCYDDKPDLSKEILKDLVRMSTQWIKFRPGGLFSDDEYSRFFTLKGIDLKEFEDTFSQELQEIDADSALEKGNNYLLASL
jgi:metal-responsive CopG/Arc/MetJ family transcriptional regulator